MKKALILITLLTLPLLGCADETDSETMAPSTSTEPSPTQSSNTGYSAGGFGCGSYDNYQRVKIDNHSYWVKVPTLCNPNPEVYKGDPGPDFGNRIDDRTNPALKGKIVEALYAKLAKTSSSGGDSN